MYPAAECADRPQCFADTSQVLPAAPEQQMQMEFAGPYSLSRINSQSTEEQHARLDS